MAGNQNAKYIQIKNDIKTAIHQNKLGVDARILSEAKLCEKYQVSRITVTKAINELVVEGYLYRIQGKGTFVKGKQISERVQHLSGFAKRMKELNLTVENKVIEKSSCMIPKQMAEFFQLPADQNVILLKRLRIVDGEPLCLSISYLLPDVFYWTLLEDMEKESMYDLLESKYHYRLGRAVQEVQVGYLNKQDAGYLNITSKDPCLKLTLFCCVNEDKPAQYEETYYLGNKYTYQITLDSFHSHDAF